jgi:hypothetical protein
MSSSPTGSAADRPTGGAAPAPLSTYVLRRSAKQLVLAEELSRSLVRARYESAARSNRAARLVAARRLERRAAAAGRRARAARAAVR